MDDKQAFFVESADGRKFKMVIRGDLGKLGVSKIRRYLKSYGVPDGQVITYNGMELSDDMYGEQFGLTQNCLLRLFDEAGMTQAEADDFPIVAPPAARADISSPHSAPNVLSHHAPQEAWSGKAQQAPKDSLGALQTRVVQLEAENLALSQQLQAERKRSIESQPPRGRPLAPSGEKGDALRGAKESLQHLSEQLGIPIQLNQNMTCVIGTDEDFSLLVTFDPPTERLYLYSTVLTQLPPRENTALRLKLYEVLLEGGLLGREVCGGGLGLSLQNELVVLSTSVPTAHCDHQVLSTVVPHFVETLKRWRDLLRELLA